MLSMAPIALCKCIACQMIACLFSSDMYNLQLTPPYKLLSLLWQQKLLCTAAMQKLDTAGEA